MNESINGRSIASRSLYKDDKVNLVGDSLPNYARIDHFTTDPYKLANSL